ncbi:MAG: 2-nitropropane dioxygenase [Betaproteobacteria bacterium RIFCSPLOWO2_02_64_14]|nr:MAG: 2-nitropropane dioxygenase [Betaproteobacteria bacterium RIFCSPLOWO2_02_64_14]
MPLSPQFRERLRIPVLGAPMFLVSGPDLVIEQCKAGVIGSFPALNARPQDELDRWLTRIETELAQCRREHPARKVAPFAVNLIMNKANQRLDADLEVVLAHKVPIVITSLSAPAALVPRVHDYGGIVFHDVIKVRHAEKALEAGVDGLIAVCGGAGGHAGTLNPFALVNELRRIHKGPLVLAGAITNGAGVLAAEAMGCDLAYLGTRFIATRESLAPERYKQMIVASSSGDIVYTPLFSGVHGSYLAGSIRNAGLDPDNLPVNETPGLYRSREDRPKTWKEIWGAGQGVGDIDDIPPVAQLVDRLDAEYRAARRRLLDGAA